MKKIGRNDPCHCGSGLKYKKCCMALAERDQAISGPVSEDGIITREIAKLQTRAAKKKKTFKLIGAFIFFSTVDGDAWLLEVTEKDALRVAKKGEAAKVIIEETDETLEINWTHSFAIRGKNFLTTSYHDKSVETYTSYPAQTIKDTMEQIFQNFTSEQLGDVHRSE